MYERFTDRARKVMQLANQEAQRFNHEYIGTEHILLGLVKEGSGVAANVLKNLDIDLRKIRLEVEKIVQSGPDMVTMGKLPQTPRAKKVIEYSIEEARNLNHNYVGTEHLLLGLLREQEGVAAQVLMNLGLKLEDVREEVLNLLGHNMATEESGGGAGERQASKGKSKTPALDSFGRDLTELARQGKLDPVIGRANEIDRVIQILSRRTKNNPVLLGEAGVGKTAIVEGLAQKVIESDVPDLLRDRRIVVLDLAMMVAGTKYRGQFEERIKAVMNEVRRARTPSCSSTSCTPWSAPAARKAPSTPPTSSSRPSPAARSSASAPRRSTSTASTSRRTAPWNAASSRSSSTRRPRTRRSRSSKGCATATRRITASRSRTRPSSRRSNCPTATSAAAACRTRPST